MCGVGDLYRGEGDEGLLGGGGGVEYQICRGVVDPLDALEAAGAKFLGNVGLDFVRVEGVEAPDVDLVRYQGLVVWWRVFGLVFIDLSGFLNMALMVKFLRSYSSGSEQRGDLANLFFGRDDVCGVGFGDWSDVDSVVHLNIEIHNGEWRMWKEGILG